jgi:hypothetical protein
MTSKTESLDFIVALKIAEGVFEQYRKDWPSYWRKMDGTPILNDVAVRMAEAFAKDARSRGETECAHCREVFEIYAGMDGFRPETAPEGYQQRIIEQMRDAALKGLKATTPRGFLGSTPDGGIDDADRT